MRNNEIGGLKFHYIVLTIIFQASGLILGKYAQQSIGAFSVIHLLSSPIYIASLGTLAMQALVWQQALRRYKLSIAYPFVSLTNFIALFASGFLFHEGISVVNIGGLILVTAGIILISREMKR